MADLTVPKTIFIEAVSNLPIPAGERAVLLTRVSPESNGIPIYFEEEELPLLQEILRMNIPKTSRTRIAQYLARIHNGKPVSGDGMSLQDEISGFSLCLTSLQGMQGQTLEIKLLGRWYPFRMPKIELLTERKKVIGLLISIRWRMVHTIHNLSRFLLRDGFNDLYHNKSIAEILLDLDIRPHVPSPDVDQNLGRQVILAAGLAEDYGRQLWIRGYCILQKMDHSDTYASDGMSWQMERLIQEPEKAIVEPDLEMSERRISRYTRSAAEETHGVLPFVRAFSLRTRTYLYTDVRNTTLYDYQTGLNKHLLLPTPYKELLDKVFSAQNDLINDLIPGKTGGLCLLAYGNPGTGKTLTAEVYAEIKERPLYTLSVSEIGTAPKEIETNLERVFARIARWDAVLLFDECDVFLTKRGDDIGQAAIVGMFLHLLDYYTGVLFLTTNRKIVLDPAIDSRLLVRLHFQDLTEDQRGIIWDQLLTQAKLACTKPLIKRLAALSLDGRKIRNFVRLLQIHQVNPINWDAVNMLLPYIQDVQK